MRSRPAFINRRLLVVAGVALMLALVVLGGNRLMQPPANAGEAADHLERPVLGYLLMDGTPYAVAEFGGKLRFDEMILDPISIEWPPTPRWQLSGWWDSIAITSDPASIGFGLAGDQKVMFGEITAPEIVTMEALVDSEWQAFPVSAPGYLVPFEGERFPAEVRWLNADGDVVWTADGPPLEPRGSVGR